MKAIFGGSVKKPLMTKVSMRHLNEIVRERNQYSRDALEAWQDFINLKGRMDTELVKVTKRNNFLVEELESWKQQFLKFQAFAEQLTKETQDLKVKIENHKRENRRLTNLIDQQKDDAARLTVRLSGTEKQRDDALEALVLQQEIAEELERERKRNKKELAALQHTNVTILRQRDEAQRVVLHLRALIDGQAHHMEHIVKSLSTAPELQEYIEEGYDDIEEEEEEVDQHQSDSNDGETAPPRPNSKLERELRRSVSRASSVGNSKPHDGVDVSPDMEERLLNNLGTRKRLSQLSMADVADRHLRDKTDAIAYIIRNISEQCAAAVEGLQLAQKAEDDEAAEAASKNDKPEMHKHKKALSTTTNGTTASEDTRSDAGSHAQPSTAHGSEMGDSEYLDPGRGSSVPPTPDLVHNRSSTSMSMNSSSTTPERHSIHSYKQSEDVPVPMKIVESDEDYDKLGEDGDHQPVRLSEDGKKYPGSLRPGVAAVRTVGAA